VPVPEVLEVGTAPVPYMVSRRVEGTEGTHHPDRYRLLHELGGHARRIHGVETSGFGETFDWSENRLSRKESWREYLEREFRGEQRLAVLEEHGMLAKPALKALRQALGEIGRWDAQPVLNHGDLRLRNVIVGPEGGIAAVIDREFCTSNAAPYWDLSLALHDLAVDGKEAFLEGYGMAPEALAEAGPALRAFNVLNYAGVVERAAEERDEGKLAWLRARLHGALDLYAL
jgi:aminoglycoside phosphotransferase (APT) family kinase protein